MHNLYKSSYHKLQKITTHSHMSPVTVERGVMWVCYPCDIFISVMVSPLLCFQNSKVRISALEKYRKAMAFDLKGWFLSLANVRPEINGLMPFTYDLSKNPWKGLFRVVFTWVMFRWTRSMKHKLCYTMYKIVKVP